MTKAQMANPIDLENETWGTGVVPQDGVEQSRAQGPARDSRGWRKKNIFPGLCHYGKVWHFSLYSTINGGFLVADSITSNAYS